MIISADVVEHVFDPDLLLTVIKRLAHPKTLILLSTPERTRLRGENCLVCKKGNHVREWAYDEFSAYLCSRGFKIIEHRILPAFHPFQNRQVLFEALRRLSRLKSISYNQAILCQVCE
jgi:2-polyprenyl-3-methyl-5-hydroxy-6-metoxy-1,4-benzoquinol methylase